jgi:hypothetical protein
MIFFAIMTPEYRSGVQDKYMFTALCFLVLIFKESASKTYVVKRQGSILIIYFESFFMLIKQSKKIPLQDVSFSI